MTAEFRHFIQEEHAMMGEADLTGRGLAPPPTKGDVRDGVGGALEAAPRASRRQRSACRNGMDGRAFQCFVERQRQDSGKPSGSIVLPAPGSPTISRL